VVSWNKHVFGNVSLALIRNRKLLAKAKVEAILGRGNGQVKILQDKINKLMDMERCMWNQRSKSNSLKDEDQNSKYFHCRATERSKRNFIGGLEDHNGQ